MTITPHMPACQFCSKNGRISAAAVAFSAINILLIKARIYCIKILFIKVILNISQGFAESLEMYDLALSQVSDRIYNIRIIHHPQDIVVSRSGLLFCGHVFNEIRNGIAF